jgi:hypothetical protein
MHPGDEEAAGGGVLGGVIDGTRTHMVVHSLVHGHNISRVVLVSLDPFLDVAALRRAPVVVPAIPFVARFSPASACICVHIVVVN